MSKCSGCFPSYNFCQFAHMGVGGCQECYDNTYKNESFKTSKYMAEINEYINESLHMYLYQRRILSSLNSDVENIENVAETVVAEPNECSICYEIMGEKNCCITECGHKFCLKCLLVAMDRNNTCPMCRHVLKDNSRGIGAAIGDRLLNEVDLQGWVDSLPNASLNLDEDVLDYIINTFGNTDEVMMY